MNPEMKPPGRRRDQINKNLPPRPALPVKRLTPMELRERQENELCFKCNNKYNKDHRCKHLFMIKAGMGEDDDGDVIMEDEEDKEKKF